MSFDPTNDRKLEHIRILENDRETERAMGHFDRMRLIHRALPEIALDEVDPTAVPYFSLILVHRRGMAWR